DLEWCGRVLLAGYQVAYVSDSLVRHSHDYSVPDLFRRYFDQGVASERTMIRGGRSSARAVRGEGLRLVASEFGWLWRTGQRRALPPAMLNEMARYAGFSLAAHHRTT